MFKHFWNNKNINKLQNEIGRHINTGNVLFNLTKKYRYSSTILKLRTR
jgi:hypothetical protein